MPLADSGLVPLALLSQFLFSGCIFGFAALHLVFEREGEYSELCPAPAANGSATTIGAVRCEAQSEVSRPTESHERGQDPAASRALRCPTGHRAPRSCYSKGAPRCPGAR